MSVRSSYVCDLTQLLTVGGLSYCPEVTNFGAVPRLPRLPDLLTTANLCCGVLSILLASQGQLTIACGLIFLAAVFDVFDGLAARAMGGGSPLGAQLDSLADMVSFGVAPGMLVWNCAKFWLDFEAVVRGYTIYPPLSAAPHFTTTSFDVIGQSVEYWLVMAAVLWIPVASAWRLAKFNIDERQNTGFLGLPTPANALFWAALVFAFEPGALGMDWPMGHGSHDERPLLSVDPGLFLTVLPFALLGISMLLGLLMLSELPLPSLKFKHFRWKGNEVIYCLLGIGLVLVVLYGILAVPLILVIYLLSPLWGKLFGKAPSPKSQV